MQLPSSPPEQLAISSSGWPSSVAYAVGRDAGAGSACECLRENGTGNSTMAALGVSGVVHMDAVLDMEVGDARTHTQVAAQKGVAAIQGVNVVGMVHLGVAKAGRVPCSVVG